MRQPSPQPAETPERLIARLYDAPFYRDWWHTVRHLIWHGAAAVPALTGALAAEPSAVRRAAAQALAGIGRVARPAARPLLDGLFAPEADVRADMALALARIAPPLKGAAPLLVGRLAAEEHLAVRGRLMAVVANVGPAARAAAPILAEALAAPRLFPAALLALRSIDPDDVWLLRAIAEQLTTPGAPFRALAAETVGRMRLAGPAWIAALEAACGSAEPATRHAARNALARIRAPPAAGR